MMDNLFVMWLWCTDEVGVLDICHLEQSLAHHDKQQSSNATTTGIDARDKYTEAFTSVTFLQP